MVQTSSSTTDEVCIHNNRTVPMGKHESCFSRCFRDSLQEREAGIRGTPRLKVWGEQTEQSNCWWRQRGGGAVGESPRTWNIDGSRQVYFCPPDRLPGALSDGQLLYCLTRKGIKKAKGREGRRREAGAAWELSIPLGVLSLGDEARSEAGMWWSRIDGRADF